MNLFQQNRFITEKDYINLCIKELTGNIEGTEKQLLNDWLSRSEKNKSEYNKLKNSWLNVNLEQVPELPDIDSEWLKLNNMIKSENNIKAEYPPKSDSFLSSFIGPKLRPALAGAFVILAALSIFIFRNEDSVPPKIKTIAALNEHKDVALPDGSLVTLNKNSKVTFIEGFDNKKREVQLTGEAFFSVVKNSRPFTVVTDNARTTVLGTKFNVRTRDNKTEVAVQEGRVSLARNELNSRQVILMKNQYSSVEKDSGPAIPKEMKSNIGGWIEGRFTFNRTKINDIIEELNSYYKVNISLSGNDASAKTLSGTFNNNSVDTVLAMICLSLDLELEKQNGKYILKSKDKEN